MKTLINKLTKQIILPIAVAGGLAFNSYSQRTEPTKNGGFKQYNENNQVIREVKFYANTKLITDSVYDNQGTHVKEEFLTDRNADGKIDYIESWEKTLDNQGKRIKSKHSEDENADGKIDYIESWESTYDNQGKLIKSKHSEDENADGKMDYIIIFEFDYDNQGKKLIKWKGFIDENADGLIDVYEEDLK